MEIDKNFEIDNKWQYKDKMVRLVEKVKEINRNKRDGYYISKATMKRSGIKPMIIPMKEEIIYKEYNIVENEGDNKEILREGKVYNCKLCAIEEEEKGKISERTGFYEEEIDKTGVDNFIYDGNGYKYILTGKDQSYLDNCILMASVRHYATYTIYYDKGIFISVMEFLKKVSNIYEDIIGIHNGTFGTDKNHFHINLTTQELPLIKSIKNNPPNGSGTFTAKSIKGYIITDKNINNMYDYVNNFFTIVSKDEELFGLYPNIVCSNLFYHKKRYYVIFYTTENKLIKRNIIINNKNVLLDIYPQIGTLDMSNIDASNVDIIDRNIEKNEIYNMRYDNNTFLRILETKERNSFETYNKNTQLDEISRWGYNDSKMRNLYEDFKYIIERRNNNMLSYIYLKIGNKNKFSYDSYYKLIIYSYTQVQKDRKNIQNYDKTRNNQASYDIYRLILSNMSYNYPNLIKDRTLIELFIKEEENNLKLLNTDLKYSFLKGNFIAKYLIEEFGDLLILTENINKNDNLLVENSDINDWLNYNFNRIGKPSVYGTITLSSIKNIRNSNIVVKMTVDHVEALKEISNGSVINKLRKWIPHFSIIYGAFSCPLDFDSSNNPIFDKLCRASSNNKKPVGYVLMENVEGGISINQLPSLNEATLFSILGQVLSSLHIAQEKYNFVHGDFHDENVLLYDFKKFELDSGASYTTTSLSLPVVFNYFLNNTDSISFPVDYLAVIIDYGTCYLKNRVNYPKRENNTNITGYAVQKFDSCLDIYTYISSIFLTILYRYPYLLFNIQNGIISSYKTNTLIYTFFYNFFTCFQNLFVVDINTFFTNLLSFATSNNTAPSRYIYSLFLSEMVHPRFLISNSKGQPQTGYFTYFNANTFSSSDLVSFTISNLSFSFSSPYESLKYLGFLKLYSISPSSIFYNWGLDPYLLSRNISSGRQSTCSELKSSSFKLLNSQYQESLVDAYTNLYNSSPCPLNPSLSPQDCINSINSIYNSSVSKVNSSCSS